MTTLTISEARNQLSNIIHGFSSSSGEAVQISVRGKTAAVLLSSEEYERMRQHMLNLEIDYIFKEFHDANVALASK